MMPPQSDKFPELARWSLAQYVGNFYDKNATATIPVPSGQIPTISNPLLSTDMTAINAGKDTYDLYCSACHGSQGRGSFLAPRLIDRKWLYGGGTDTAVFSVVEKGIPGKLMPSHKKIAVDKRWQVIAMLRYLGGLPEPLAQPAQ
jgi:mono/diheme cytochrome c family protein